MCKLCDEGRPQNHFGSRRRFLKGAAATGVAAAGLNLFAPRTVAADDGDAPADSGRPGRRYVIRGGAVMSMDSHVGDFPQADVLVEGKKILAVGPNLHVGGATEIDARGRIVMPGFIDTHHHQFETALRSFLADGVLIIDGSNSPSGSLTYFENILLKFAPVYRPQDVYINELFGGLSQLDDGVTTVHDVSQIHHSPQHSDAAIQALFDTGRRAAFGYFESAGASILGTNPGNQYPQDAFRIKNQWFASSDQLVSMIMGGEVYIDDKTTQKSWTIGRQLGLQIAAHILSPFGIRPIMDALVLNQGGSNHNIGIGPDNLFIHMTGMADTAWQKVKDVGAQVSIAFPIEMNMRHGMPPILKMQSLGMEPSLSVDVECTLTADFFTQMRSAMNLQRALVNQMILEQGNFYPPNQWPTPAPGTPPLLVTRDVLRYATMNGAKALRLDNKVGSLTPGKEADIIILDATRINVAPLNHVPGAVVSLMDRTNVETVIVAGKVRKWKGQLLDVDLPRLRQRLEASRDYIFNAAGISQDLFRSN
ncbi:MAG TPA: amidohydrolase family protein [Xanthobacteraceae bacterium]|jgi:cytosine/adenosine deaminase-related metal-dependent hydrolase|nr:amidohydrolase family protein [Xanthobacteraceae bacterium]